MQRVILSGITIIQGFCVFQTQEIYANVDKEKRQSGGRLLK